MADKEMTMVKYHAMKTEGWPTPKKPTDHEVAVEVRQILDQFWKNNEIRKHPPHGIPDPIRQIERLCWLLGLSPEERQFVKEAAAMPRDYSGLLIFCDWLGDQQRHAEEGEIELLVPKAGDVLVVTFPSDDNNGTSYAGNRAKAMELVEEINKCLVPLNRGVQGIGLPDNWQLQNMTPSMMAENGWVKMTEVESVRKENEDLKERLEDVEETARIAMRDRDQAQDDLESFRKRVKR